MKKRIFFGFFVCLMIMGLASSLSSNMLDSYAPKETVTFNIFGDIREPIKNEDIRVLKVNNEIPTELDVKKLDGIYYVWFSAPASSGNYTLKIDEIVVGASGTTEVVKFEKNFSVIGALVDYYIKPGFVIAKDNFELKVWLNEDVDKQIEIDFPKKSIVTLKPGENIVKISFTNVNSSLVNAKIGKYNLPIYIQSSSADNNGEIIYENYNPEFVPSEIVSLALKGFSVKYDFWITNNGRENTDWIYLDYDRSRVIIEPDERFYLNANQSKSFSLYLKNNSRNFDDVIILRHKTYSDRLPVRISFTNDSGEVQTNYSFGSENTSLAFCTNIGGKTCLKNQYCNGTIIESSSGQCCSGTCNALQSSSGGDSSLWGYIIGLIVVAIIGYAWYKYKKVPGK